LLSLPVDFVVSRVGASLSSVLKDSLSTITGPNM
jgi:hypothetical protein